MQIILGIIAIIVLVPLVTWLVGERGRVMLPSTWKFLRASGWRRFHDGTFRHSYIYARFPVQYIGYGTKKAVPKMNTASRQSAADHYHGKVLPTALAEALVTHDHDIALRDLEQVIPYPVARDLVLQGPPEIAVFDCPCRATRDHPCQPTQVCMIVGQPFVDFILEHHPEKSRRVTPIQAAEILRAEHARGHIHAAYFKDAMLDRFYAICNCCKCCCGGIESMVKHGVPMLTSSGYVAQVDESHCAACGDCVKACPFGAISLDGFAHVEWAKCMGCGVCEGQCQVGGIALVRDERKGVPLDVRALTA
ncbi:MAG: 4Fe-4S binding protein [Chloroflexi bacterium]|nr:4Fe-4S binding protein [Chloroflexota bacterium]